MELGSIHALKVVEVHRPLVRERLLDEGRAQATLVHPNVLRVSDVLLYAGAPILIMEFVDGPSLERLLYDEGRPDLATALSLAVGITRGLRAAHAHALVHRDLKPANVLLVSTPDGWVPKLADFGLVKILDEERRGRRAPTRTGIAMGTAEFMAPEQIRNAAGVDHRADLYSLGCVLYALLTGVLPFPFTDLVQLHEQILARAFVRPADRIGGLPLALDTLVSALLAADPARRPQSCDEVLAVLESEAARVPTGPSTFRPSDLLSAAAGSGPVWTTVHGEAFERRLPAAPRSHGLAVLVAPLLLPSVLAGLAGRPVEPPPPAPVAAVARPVPVPAPLPAPSPVPVPAPSPVPAPVVRDEPPVAPEPAPPSPVRPALTTVRFTGDASRVWLVGQGRRHPLPLAVQPGEYEVVALFRGTELVDAGRITVKAGAPIVLRCSAFAVRCRP